MSERFERLVTFGAPPVNYNRPETWTDDVRALYKRLQGGDYKALAPLLKCDIGFLRDLAWFRAFVVLKYGRGLPNERVRIELRKIANVIARPPGRFVAKLPWGDRLEAELNGLITLIESHKLMELKNDCRAILDRLEVVMSETPREEIATLAFSLGDAVQTIRGRVRRPRSWALQALADHYGVEPKQIEKRIDRENRSRRRRR